MIYLQQVYLSLEILLLLFCFYHFLVGKKCTKTDLVIQHKVKPEKLKEVLNVTVPFECLDYRHLIIKKYLSHNVVNSLPHQPDSIKTNKKFYRITLIQCTRTIRNLRNWTYSNKKKFFSADKEQWKNFLKIKRLLRSYLGSWPSTVRCAVIISLWIWVGYIVAMPGTFSGNLDFGFIVNLRVLAGSKG